MRRVPVPSILLCSCLFTMATGCMDMGASSTEITEYQQLAAQVRSAEDSYVAGISAIEPTLNCAQLHEQYESRVRPAMTRMAQLSGRMDRCMCMHSTGASAADLSCMTNAMTSELDAHHAIACSSGSAASDQSEIVRHADAMRAMTAHVTTRCGEMMSAMGSGTMTASPSMGTCATSAATMSCGGMMGR